MVNQCKQPGNSLRPDLKTQDFEYLAIITRNGLVAEAAPFASYEDAKEFLLTAVCDMDNIYVSTLREINENSLNHYSIWQLDDMGGRYEDVT